MLPIDRLITTYIVGHFYSLVVDKPRPINLLHKFVENQQMNPILSVFQSLAYASRRIANGKPLAMRLEEKKASTSVVSNLKLGFLQEV